MALNHEGKECIRDVCQRLFGETPEIREWCRKSEKRLKLKLVRYKPIGVNARFQMMMLTDLMNRVYSDEDDINFEDYLARKDLQHYRNHVKNAQHGSKRVDLTRTAANGARNFSYSPAYGIRPSVEEIGKKLNEWNNVAELHESEEEVEGLRAQTEFTLPQS